MRTKHFINDADKLVEAALKSQSVVRPDLSLDLGNKILYGPRHAENPSQVAIISGGGSGHEPSFTGLVGEGVLSASVVGTIFASPSARQVLNAIEGVDGSRGILVTVMNYTGDVLNFGVAIEKARARNPKLRIEMLVVGDDVGVTRSRAGKVGRRGIAGTVLVHKITGALAAAGSSLDKVVEVGRLVAANLASIGVSLNRVHVPGRPCEQDTQDLLGIDEVELGMGIHNEAGCGRRSGDDARLPVLVKDMLQQLLDPNDDERNYLPKATKDVVVLINNLGALSVLELGGIVLEVTQQLLQDYRLNAVRVFSGTFMTSLDGPGFSVSLLNVVDTGVQQTLLDLVDAPSNVSGWHTIARSNTSMASTFVTTGNSPFSYQGEELEQTCLECDMGPILAKLGGGLRALVAAEPDITRFDAIVGDGDCGTTLKRGAEGIQKALATSRPKNIIKLLSRITEVVESTMDGTSGALYGIFLNSLLHYFRSHAEVMTVVDRGFWTLALDSALTVLSKYTPAQVGDRTMMDALIPFTLALKASSDVQHAASVAKEGALKTRSMRPGLGRTVYIGNEEAWLGKVPDPGAWGLSEFFEGLVR
ncbi:hypothetical protein LTR84_007232 [Exophiala bonariae]|uniref:Dihydroxyacetone kinase n=1 Tax=Exophiala bonariae TaxID=1690606 RepID=A0AAV9N1J1_9EURO|nr:hypothetical protein LTR84_007232 [Exophiala bonariae]